MIATRTARRDGRSDAVFKNKDQKVDRKIAVTIILLLVAGFAAGGYLIRWAFVQKPIVRSALENDLVAYQIRLEKNPRDLKSLVGAAKVHERMGDTPAAKAKLKNALRINPNYWDARFKLGRIYLSQDQQKSAVREFKKAIKAKPGEELAYYQLGLIFYKDKKYYRAIEHLEKTVEISPILADAHFYLARTYEQVGRLEPARNHYEETLRFVPDYSEAKAGLARVTNQPVAP